MNLVPFCHCQDALRSLVVGAYAAALAAAAEPEKQFQTKVLFAKTHFSDMLLLSQYRPSPLWAAPKNHCGDDLFERRPKNP